jgi:hypothetical protein
MPILYRWMMDYTRKQISDACREYGSKLENLPQNIDGPQLLFAISGNESSFGANCTPRYEPAYDTGGIYADTAFLARFGRLAACSLGPWQIMFANCPPNFTPESMQFLSNCAVATAAFLSRQLARFEPTSLASIAAIWNGGNPGAIVKPQVAAYAAKLAENYLVPMVED